MYSWNEIEHVRQVEKAKKSCQCEHGSHFVSADESVSPLGKITHGYGMVPATNAVQTAYGMFDVCIACTMDCFKGIN